MSTELARLRGRLPQVTDRLLLELINDLRTADDLVRRRAANRPAGRLLGLLTGADRRRDTLTLRGLVDNQRALQAMIVDLVGDVGFSMDALACALEDLDRVTADVEWLGTAVVNLSQECDRRLDAVRQDLTGLAEEVELLRLEQRAAADREGALAAWGARVRYDGLPWLIQVVLVGREIFASAGGLLHHRDPRPSRLDRVAHQILAQRTPPDAPVTTAAALGAAMTATPAADRELVAAVLGAGQGRLTRWQRQPLAALLREALARPDAEPAAVLQLVRAGYGWVDGTFDAHGFVREVVQEQADATAATAAELRGAARPAIEPGPAR
ncbi:hypothetical protein KZZ52_54740 [Dactylosporangium sp. AC04546]|uniref:hypothetical protein n=1 Tax=Dactylosporangium sp. AC04546 TaxID=2862460 RepID=UPI001EDF2680|nr:hypothetical protein [Dactylosporangium sp. AC04546]WVK82898.1 hypothetical protein KZZ52_54740 [Dactylosporangium sp. AC04546]